MERNMNVVFGELLIQILEYVDSGDLFQSARLVSRTWRDGATKILLKRQSLKTCFELAQDKRHFQRYKVQGHEATSIEEKEKTPGLSDLADLLDSPNHFPSRDFGFIRGRLDLPDALAFFSRYGEKVQSLTCDIVENEPTSRDGVLQREIFKLTPDLQHLEFSASPVLHKSDTYWSGMPNGADYDGNEDSSNQGPGQGQGQGQSEFHVKSLQRLKSIKFDSSIKVVDLPYHTFLNIRPLAPQLSTVFISHFEKKFWVQEGQTYLKLLAQSAQLMTERLTCSVFYWNYSQFNKIANCNLKVSQLHIPSTLNSEWMNNLVQDPYPVPVVNSKEIPKELITVLRILNNTKSTLESLSCCPLFFLLFKKMEKSKFQFETDKISQTFTNFPKLKNLVLNLNYLNFHSKLPDFQDFQDLGNQFNAQDSEKTETESESDSDSECYAELPSCFKEVRNVKLKLPEGSADSCAHFFNIESPKLSKFQNSNLNRNKNLNSKVTSLSIFKETGVSSEILGKIIKCFSSLKKLTLTIVGDAKEISSQILCNHDDQKVSLETLLSFFVTDLNQQSKSKVEEIDFLNSLNLHGLEEIHLNFRNSCGSTTGKCLAIPVKKFSLSAPSFSVLVNDICPVHSKLVAKEISSCCTVNCLCRHPDFFMEDAGFNI